VRCSGGAACQLDAGQRFFYAHVVRTAAFVQPVEHVDALSGTGTGARNVGKIITSPAPRSWQGAYSPDTATLRRLCPRQRAGPPVQHDGTPSGAAAAFVTSRCCRPPAYFTDPWDTLGGDRPRPLRVGRCARYYTRWRFPSARGRAELTATTRTGGGVHYSRNRPASVLRASGARLDGTSATTSKSATQHHDHRSATSG